MVTLGITFSPIQSLLFFICMFCFIYCCNLSLCWGLSWGINLRFSWISSERVLFPEHVWWISNLSPMHSCFWMSWYLMSGSQKRKQKKEGGFRHWSFKSPGSHFRWRGGTCNSERRCNSNVCLPFCLHLCNQKQQSVIRTQVPDIWRAGSLLFLLAPTSCMQATVGKCAQG